MYLTLLIPYDLDEYYIFIHNKDQMYFPKIDQIYGSYYFYLDFSEMENYSCLGKQYTLLRTHWKNLDKDRNRCDERNTEAQTTNCITQFLEQNVKCSMGLKGGSIDIKRYSLLTYCLD